MPPNEIKAEMVRRSVSMSDIARALGVSVSHVSQTVLGKRRSPKVEQAVADAIGRPVARVFERVAQRERQTAVR